MFRKHDIPDDRGALPLTALLAAVWIAVFVLDLLTPLGHAVWIFYFIPIALTVLGRDARAPVIAGAASVVVMLLTLVTDEPGAIHPQTAYINRIIGIVVICSVAVLARNLIATRNRFEEESWLQGAHNELFAQLQGNLSVQEIGERALGTLARLMDAPVGALYGNDQSGLVLIAARGLYPGADLPRRFEPGEGLVGEAVRGEQAIVVTELPEGQFSLRSGLAEGRPSHLVVMPVRADGALHGVLELALLKAPDARCMNLLDRAAPGLAVAIRTAYYRDRIGSLLEETRRQSEALQAHQQELEAANAELEDHQRSLLNAQVRLEEQQAELEASNAQLELHSQDLEQQKQALVRARQEAELASRHKSEFLANMSHELRTPLNSMLILARLLVENKGGRLSDDQVRYAETIHSSGNNLLTLINDILDLSRIEAGAVELHAEPVQLPDLVSRLQAVFEPLMAEKGLGFSVELSGEAPESFVTDGQRLQQILTNLLSNALKFTESGEVGLRIEASRAGAISFVVRDTGPGIPEDKHEVIFEAFRQADGSTHRQHGGTGLGLSISRELARLLGGELRLVSKPGAGAAFTLTIPARLADAGSAIAARLSAPNSPDRTQPLRTAAGAVPDDRHERRHPDRLVLVVEDDVSFARILYDLAHEVDFDCVIATTTDEGMDLARDLAPSAILLDIGLPDGSGLGLLDRLKRNPDTRHIPVHVVSVSDFTRPALELGAVGYALKPVEREQIIEALRKLEDRLEQSMRRILVVEDDAGLRESISRLLSSDGIAIHGVGTATEALDKLAAQSFDCVVLDLTLPDANGYEVLETMSANERYSFPPVIVYTGRPLSADDEQRLRRFSRSVIIKGAGSPGRLLDEVTLFLHQVESRLPPESQRLLRAARDRDALFEGRAILVVEDDVRNVFALTSVFEPRGAKVVIARNGREALHQLRADRFDLVLMDIMMPEMDGLTAMREIRSMHEFKSLPIIALTAKAMRDDYEQCLAAGASDYLPKPIDLDKLLSLCRVWVAR